MKKNRLTGKKCEKRGTGKFICFLAAMLLLGGCGQADGAKTDGGKTNGGITDGGITAGTDIGPQMIKHLFLKSPMRRIEW